ncbi:MAG: queuine tRNA-ribosyltransferase [Herpetosiphonaceae bacterium]|nr:MAG: queuine tRNA-ribosyltransferase [Herpetosiphonaceae bacterium]
MAYVMESFQFTLEHTDRASGARAGVFTTPHGVIRTPVFMPVGTQATVKTLTPEEVVEAGAQIILANTYHLYLRPGSELIADMEGIHRFMSWSRPILTDSGGFQVFSLGPNSRIDEEGVTFRSHIDGSQHRFTPERAIEIQEQIGADIIMAFDECAPQPTTWEYTRAAMERTHRWLERCVAAKKSADQALFGIVQGGVEEDLRRESARFVGSMPVRGFGIGGLSVGEPKEQMYEMTAVVTAELPADRPRYLMGVGSPEDLIEGVARGVDMFDCVLPTRLGRNGALLVPTGRLNIRNAQFARDERPIEEGCDCYTCQRFSRAYLRHLFRAEEILGLRLATIHNVRFLIRLMERAREAILADRFTLFREEFLATFRTIPHEIRAANRAARERSLGRPGQEI